MALNKEFTLDPLTLDASIRDRWRHEVTTEEQAAESNSVEWYFGSADRWPSFATIEERLVIEAMRVATEVVDEPLTERWVERSLSQESPPMRGSPDLVEVAGRTARVIEYKTGRVEVEDAEPTGRYGLQVLMYAAMVQSLGLLVEEGEIRAVGRNRVSVSITEESIDLACEIVQETLDEFNGAAASGNITTLANPSDQACRFCPHALSCPALWVDSGTEMLDEIQAVGGIVTNVQHVRLGSTAIQIDANEGTLRGLTTVSGLDVRRLPILAELEPGDQVRMSGLQRRPGRLALSAGFGTWVLLDRIVD